MSGPVEFVGLGVTTTYTRVDCAPPPLLSSATNRSAFLQDLLPLLAALPAAVATTPLGFASLQSGGASVRGLCLGATLEKECVGCLAAAAENLTGCFLGASRRRRLDRRRLLPGLRRRQQLLRARGCLPRRGPRRPRPRRRTQLLRPADARGAWATRRDGCRRAPGVSTARTSAWPTSLGTTASCESRRRSRCSS
jgi:hypothetical protein